MLKEEITKSSEKIFEGKVFTVLKDKVEVQSGSIHPREVVLHHGGVAVLPILENGNILLVRQYRYAAKKFLLEIPAGKLEQNEDPKSCGIRELEEETGARSKIFEHLVTFFPTPGYCSEKIYLYVAKELTFFDTRFDAGEFIESIEVSMDEALKMIANGEIEDAKTIIAISYYLAKK